MASEAHLRSILATVPDAIIAIDEAGIILSFSPAAEKMFGYVESEVLGQNVSMLMPSPDRERHDAYMQAYLRTGERKIIGIGRVTTARRRNGSVFPAELAVAEAVVGGHKIFTGYLHDLSERHRADLRLRHLQAELAHVGRISEMASLASSLAHEINQPLTAITAYCEAARDLLTAEPGEKASLIREALDQAAQEAIRAGRIVQHLRSFVRPGETNFGREFLSKLVVEANALALVGSREHGVEVQVNLAAVRDEVWVDRIQVQQVLTNLVRNALDAMQSSEHRLLTIASEDGPDGFVTVSVTDTGHGIGDEIASELFRPFVTSKVSGMGVGLSICRTIIEAHGGRIWFDSSPSGTAFHFTLQTVEADDA